MKSQHRLVVEEGLGLLSVRDLRWSSQAEKRRQRGPPTVSLEEEFEITEPVPRRAFEEERGAPAFFER